MATKIAVNALIALLFVTIPLRGDVFQMPAGLRSLEMITVGDPENLPDDNGFGAVSSPYKIGKFEVTTGQYVEFLNTKGKSSPDGSLWFNDMDLVTQGPGVRCGIERTGELGSYVHRVSPERANRPVNYVSFWDACRFCNWLHNGQGDGDTETGAYTLNGYAGTDGRRVQRNPGARWFVPTDNEWYKAAYYDSQKQGGAGYWDYPTRSDAKPSRDMAGANAANYYDGSYLVPVDYFTDSGAFAASVGPYGTFDQAGNVFEWTEGLRPPLLRNLWGGSYGSDDGGRNVPAAHQDLSSKSDTPHAGFRIAGAVSGTTSRVIQPTDVTVTKPSASPDFPRRPWRNPETGKQFFPMAWYCYLSDETDLDEIAKEGANLVLFIASYSDVDDEDKLIVDIQRMSKYLDEAHKRDLKVHVQLASWYGPYINHDLAAIDRQRRWVEAVSDHPAFFGYQLYDEPEYHSGGGLGVQDQRELKAFVEALQQNRDNIRKWDSNPDHSIQVVFNLVPLSSWTAYLPVIDSFQVDRYPCDATQAYFGHQGDWGPLIMAWSMAHGVAAMHDMPHLHNPSPCLQGVGPAHREGTTLGLWRNPLYEESRYMAYSSLTVGSWGVFHWIRNIGHPNSSTIMRNVGRLYAELRQLLPAFEQSYEHPPFKVRHDHQGITRDFLTDTVSDITTLALEDGENYYIIAADNSSLFKNVQFRMKLPQMQGTFENREAHVLNEDWSRSLTYDAATEEWQIASHHMCFGDVNVWVIPKAVK